MPRIEIGAIVALGIAVASGLIWVGQISQAVDHLEQSVRELKEGQVSATVTNLKEEVERIRVDVEDIAGDRFSKFPVGSIIPFVGERAELESLVRWKICDGSILEGEIYKDSPFYNRPLPELDRVFLRATLSNDKLTFGGSDTHSHTQAHTHNLPHTHSGRTEWGKKENAPPNQDRHDGGGNHRHNFTTDPPDKTTTTPPSSDITGKEMSIPRYVNVFYIIKVL